MSDITDTEKNGIVPDEESQNSASSSKLSTSSEVVDASNNSVSEKVSPGKPKPKSQKQSHKRDSARRKQSIRQAEFLEKQKQNGFNALDGRTKTFVDHLFRPTHDVRDVKSKVFKNQLMLSEGLDEVPGGFAKNWMMRVCPVGSRCLVVANKGHTGAYTKSGYHIISHPSSLPMGNMMYREGSSGPCILDCIYCNELDTYFVLDLMCWDGQPVYNCDTHTRQRLLHDRVREYNLNRPSHINPYPIVALRGYTPTKSNICGAVRETPYRIDGLLFLEKHLKYIPGSNPLCLWLTLERLPLKMKIEIPDLGIVANHNYTDPVALALAHGISPAIISQAFSSPGAAAPNQRYGYQQNSGGHQFYQQQQQQQRSQHQKGWQNRGGASASANANGMAYLAEVMAGMNIRFPHGNNYSQYGMNNSNSRMANSGRYQQDHFQYRKNGMQNHDYFNKKREKKNNKKKVGKSRKPDQPKYSNWEKPHGVMKSQWIGSEKPESFEEDYLTCVCPMSKRRIIVASGGSTCTYNKYGKLVDTFSSPLPNGSKESSGDEESDLTILDSLWCGSSQTFFVIDVMHWQQQSFYDSEAEMRFSWLDDTFSTTSLKSGQRELPVQLLQKYASNQTDLTSALGEVDFKVDGLLSFRRKSTYSKTTGVNAVWMKLDMLESLLGYAPPTSVTFKTTTEKERKQRDYFIGLGTKKDSAINGEKDPAEHENENLNEEEPGETDC